jgi:hypothetical protein
MTRREEIARIIDPGAWYVDSDGHTIALDRSDDALAKAAAILALPPLPVEPGEVVKEINAILSDFDADADALHSEETGERADLWTDVDVPITLLRTAAATITAQAAEIERMAAEAKRLNDVWARPTAQLLEDERKAAECDTAIVRAETAERKLANAVAVFKNFVSLDSPNNDLGLRQVIEVSKAAIALLAAPAPASDDVKAEREACAALAESVSTVQPDEGYSAEYRDGFSDGADAQGAMIAAHIRARSEP